MATSSSKPPVCLQSQRESWLSRCLKFPALNVGPRVKSCGFMLRLESRRKAPEVVVRSGCGCHQSGGDGDGTTEDDQEFVKVLREAQPYISIHRDSIFVLLISAEIVASPHLDAILKEGRRPVRRSRGQISKPPERA